MTDKTFGSVVDHGGARETATPGGGERESAAGRGRFDLVPPYPILRLAQHYELGAMKYQDRNWQKGLKLSRLLDSAERHLNTFKDGDRSEDHLAAVLWNIAGYMHTEREIREGRLPAVLRDVPWEDSIAVKPKPAK